MEPNSSQSQPTSQPAAAPELSLTPPPRSRRKAIILGAAALVLIVAGAFWLTGKLLSKDGSASLLGGDHSLTMDRDGYDRKKLGSDVADPMALVLTKRADPEQIASSGVTAISACSIITPTDVEHNHLTLYPNAFGSPFLQNYLDTSGRAAFSRELNNLSGASEAPSCYYGLQSNTPGTARSIGVVVNQSFAISDQAVANSVELLHYEPKPDINGIKVYQKSTSSIGVTSYLLRTADTTVTLDFELDDTGLYDGLVKTAAANLANFSKHPTGRIIPAISSPTFTASYVRACDLFGNAEVKQTTGVDASPLATERWATATGLANYSSVSDYKTKSNYVRNTCLRRSAQPNRHLLADITDETVEVTATTYENADAASKGLLYTSIGGDNDSKQKGTGLGDESYVYLTPKDHQQAIVFRQGRAVVEVIYDFAKQKLNTNEMAQKLTPLTDHIAGQLKDFK
jgi:hypothetical protein